ncbi:MAG: hypothetical protein ED859_18640 [Desulfuromonadales bacterium]|nr:MAG: hypothetical protein ED859_18640 [Desulfuromonadales bacterium]
MKGYLPNLPDLHTYRHNRKALCLYSHTM